LDVYVILTNKIPTYANDFIALSTPATISSLQNPVVRYVVKLRDNRFRQRERIVVVDGIREIERAIDAGLTAKSVFIGVDDDSETVRLGQRCQSAVVRVSDAVLQKIAFGQHHRGAVALFAEPDKTLQELVLSELPIVIVLDAIEKPGNVGAVFRSADAINADAVVVCDGACDLFNPSVIRASLGTVFSVPCAQANREATLQWLATHRIKPITARVDATASYWEVDYRQGIAIVVGSEAQGLGEQWNRIHDSMPVRIPMSGSADSLNASVSAALLMFEARRQRGL
jgi:RNA methyltransferase, TrmH family